MHDRQALPPPLSCTNTLGNMFLKELRVIQFPEVWAITIFCVVSMPFGKRKGKPTLPMKRLLSLRSQWGCQKPVAGWGCGALTQPAGGRARVPRNSAYL